MIFTLISSGMDQQFCMHSLLPNAIVVRISIEEQSSSTHPTSEQTARIIVINYDYSGASEWIPHDGIVPVSHYRHRQYCHSLRHSFN